MFSYACAVKHRWFFNVQRPISVNPVARGGMLENAIECLSFVDGHARLVSRVGLRKREIPGGCFARRGRGSLLVQRQDQRPQRKRALRRNRAGGEWLRTSAASSAPRPPKNLSSITCAPRGSIRANASSASRARTGTKGPHADTIGGRRE